MGHGPWAPWCCLTPTVSQLINPRCRPGNKNHNGAESEQHRTACLDAYTPDNIIAKMMFREAQSGTLLTQAIGEHKNTIRDVIDGLARIIEHGSG
jgi:hypothetical protein